MTSHQDPGRAKKYNREKLFFSICISMMSILLLPALVASGYSQSLANSSRTLTANPYGALLVFAFAVAAIQTGVTLPLTFYSGYSIEHRYGLSNQSPGRWAWERIKGLIVGLPVLVGVLLFLFYCLGEYGTYWWLPVGTVLTLLSVLLARLAPGLLLPLFYTFTPLSDGPLKERILRFCSDAGLHIDGVFSFNLSKNTKKANAGITGIGKARRIILGDTLVREFSEDEIETVFAHEVGHYKHRHVQIGILVSFFSTFAGLSVTALLYGWSVRASGFSAPTELAALPFLAFWLSLFGLVTAPLGNLFSRRHERQADAFAVAKTGNKAAFISALRKLAAMNLADPEPHPLVEYLFHSHPSIGRRIKAVELL